MSDNNDAVASTSTTEEARPLTSRTRDCSVCLAPMVLGVLACQNCGSEEWHWNENSPRFRPAAQTGDDA
ncbi:hypothetical protein GCM10028801_06950 [Nocardioides maradonensis]